MKSEYPTTVYLNGEWVAPEEAKISVFDRGFLFADGVYEVISAYHGQPFALIEHLTRLQNSLEELSLEFDVSVLPDLINKAIQKSGLEGQHAAVYMQVTRGIAPRKHLYPEHSVPTLMLYAQQFNAGKARQNLIKVFVTEDKRWHRCHIKSIALVEHVRANTLGNQAGAQETVFFRNGVFTEGSHSNLFFVKKGEVFTHPNGPYILPGITRSKVIALSKSLHLSVNEQPVRLSDIADMEEAFITGTGSEITAIGSFLHNGKEIQLSTEIGPITQTLQEAFAEATLKQ